MSAPVYFLPEEKQFKTVDVLLLTCDAWIDHPSFGIAIIARYLESLGFSVAIAGQPEYYSDDYLASLPDVRLLIGITSGNLDSVVANYSSSRNPRKDNPYTIDGKRDFSNGIPVRPDRALIPLTQFVRKRYKEIPVILGGLEASIRRFAHYDFIQQKLRKSILTDAKADLLVYGMGERSIAEILRRISQKESLWNIPGTVIRLTGEYKSRLSELKAPVTLPSIQDMNKDPYLLVKEIELIEDNMIFDKASALIQNQDGIDVLSFPPQKPLSQEEMDALYRLPFRKDYPEYAPRVPAWNMIKDSVTSHRGCYGKCSFCAIASHQGPAISFRSKASIKEEILTLVSREFFRGTITDIGGPTANMYGTRCKIGWCKNPSCLYPKICPNLEMDPDLYRDLLKEVAEMEKVKHVFVSSGIRFDIALVKKEETEWLITRCTSGHLKIAPEHIDNRILNLMRKPGLEVFDRFLSTFDSIRKKYNLNYYILPYLILSHPGSTDETAVLLGKYLRDKGISTFQYQDFTPVPQTLSGAYFFAGKESNGNPISIPRFSSLRNSQREILEKFLKQKNHKKKPD